MYSIEDIENIIINGDPSKYLNSNDESTLEVIDSIKSNYDRNRRYNETKHQELIKMYEIIVKETAKFIKSYSNNDEITLCAALSELMWRGYISYNKKMVFTDPIEDAEELEPFLGINVLYGKACCRNISTIFKDIMFDTLKVNAPVIGNCEYDLGGSFFDTKTKRMMENGELILNSFCVTYEKIKDPNKINHACIIFPYKKYFLVYDPTNIRVFSTKSITGKELQGCGKINIQPSSLVLFNGHDNFSMNQFVKNLEKSSIPTGKTSEKILENFYEGIESIADNQSVCDDFHLQIAPILNDVEEYRTKKLIKK